MLGIALYIRGESLSLVAAVFLELRGPESKVVADELHDGGGVLVLVLLDLVDVGNGVVEGLLGQLAGLGRVVPHLIEENRVVQGQSQSAGVGGLQVLLRLVSGSLVGLLSSVSVLVALGSRGVFGDVAVVVSLHFVVEDDSFGSWSLGEELAVDEVQDLVAEFVKFCHYFGLVGAEKPDVLGALLLLLLLDGGECAPGGPP